MYNFFQILYPSSFIFFVSLIIILFGEKNNYKLFLFAILFKVLFYLIYFTFIFDGSQTFLDDLTYLDKGKKILDLKFDSVNYFTEVVNIVQSNTHFLYPMINSFAIYLFEPEYFAPVALNVAFSFFTGLLLFKHLYKGNNRYLIFFFVFLNPTIITWSSFFNLKDTLLLFLTVVNFISIKFYKINFNKFLLFFLPSLILIYFLRSYYCYIIFVALIFIIFKNFNFSKITLLILILVILFISNDNVQNIISLYITSLNKIFSFSIYNFVKFFFTPIPFNTTGTYKFLDFVQIYHYLMIPFFLFGYLLNFILFITNKLNIYEIFILICFTLFMILASGMEIINGPRHRYQMEAFFIIYQYKGIIYFFKKKKLY